MAFTKIRRVYKIIKKQTAVIIFFALFFLVSATLDYINNLTECFPVTVITVDQEIVNSVMKINGICDSSIFSEKMTFDSSIFNHYETPPVKDIFFLTVKLPYGEWESIKESENATVEANPFVESVVVAFYRSKLKWLTLCFTLIFICGLFLFAFSIPSKKEGLEIFKANSITTILIFILCSAAALTKFSGNIIIFSVLSLSSVFIVYLLFLVLYYRFVMDSSKTKSL
jgi:hypothetical protein